MYRTINEPPNQPLQSRNGEVQLDGDVYVAMNRFSVLPGMEAAFEQRFASRESNFRGQSTKGD